MSREPVTGKTMELAEIYELSLLKMKPNGSRAAVHSKPMWSGGSFTELSLKFCFNAVTLRKWFCLLGPPSAPQKTEIPIPHSHVITV